MIICNFSASRMNARALLFASACRLPSAVKTTHQTASPGSSCVSFRIVAPQPISMSSLCAPRQSTFLIPPKFRPFIVVSLALFLPDDPRRLSLSEHVFEVLLFLERVHARPIAVMREGHELAFGDEAPERFLDQFLSFA